MSQTKRQIQALLAEAGIRPLKRFGQNFLIDQNLLAKIIQAAELSRDDVVLEVGPGTGSLTEELLARAGRVIAVEIDHGLQRVLAGLFQGRSNFTLVADDVLDGRGGLNPAVVHAVRQHAPTAPGQTILVANLPYNIATPLVMELLLDMPEIRRLCIMVQAEVGDRFTAHPSTKAFGPASIISQALTAIRRITTLPPTAFWPAPEVTSMILRFDRTPTPPVAAEEARAFAAFVSQCFQHRRKQLRWMLRRLLSAEQREQWANEIEAVGERRPEELTVDQWITLARRLGRLQPQGEP